MTVLLRVAAIRDHPSKKSGAELRVSGFLERLKAIFSPVDEEAWPPQYELPATRATGDASDLRRLISRLEEPDNADIMTGCVQLLGLDRVKARVGPRWDSIADKALRIAEESLVENLGPADIYRFVGDASFQICFETADENYARLQVNHISAAIEARIATELGALEEEVSVSTFVTPVPRDRIKEATAPLSALHANLLEIRAAVNARAVKRHSIPVLGSAGVLFQPLWCNHDFGRTMNRCVLDAVAGAAATEHLEDLDELEDFTEALSNLDCVLFAKSVEALHQALGDIKRATILVPVHFQTLAREHPQFIDVASILPPQYRRLVLLDVMGVPTTAATQELERALETGRAITDRIVLQMSPVDHRMQHGMRKLVWGLSMNLGELDSEDPVVANELARFKLSCTEHGFYSFAYGANTIGKAVGVVEAGFDYVGGTAVSNTIPSPRPHARFKPLFGDVTPKSSGFDTKVGLRDHPRFAPVNPNSTVTLPSGEQFDCRIPNVSASGAVVLCDAAVAVRDFLVLGSIPAQVVRITKRGFAVRFLEVQRPSAIEIALQTAVSAEQLLGSLRSMQV